MAVLIVAPEADLHAQAVAQHVDALGGDVQVVDVATYPQHINMVVRYDCCGESHHALVADGLRLDFATIGAIWWRRPHPPQITASITDPVHRAFATNEAHEALAGFWHALDVFWVNDPAKDHVAHRKVMQLQVAQDAGLRVPETLISNDPGEVRRFVDARGYRDVVYKAFSALEEDWRETRLLRPEELALLDNVQYAPVIFQEYVEAGVDVRVTIVGDEIFAAAIHSQETSYPVDFRMDMGNALVEAVALPDDVAGMLEAFMAELGLVYGAIDMRRRPDGEYVFLEINPAGQWLFIEQKTKQPIAATLAALLVAEDRKGAGERHN